MGVPMSPPMETLAEPLPRMGSGFLAQLDRPFLATLATFLSIELTGAVALAQRPRVTPEEVSLEQAMIPERIIRTMFPLRDHPLPPPKAEPKRVATRPAAPRGALAPVPATPHTRSEDELRNELRHQGVLGVLTSTANPLGEVVKEAIGPVAVEQQVAEAIKGAHGRIDQGAAGHGPFGPKDSGPVASTIDAPVTGGGTEVKIARRSDPGAEPLPGVVIDHPEGPLPPGMDPAQVTSFIRGQLSRVQACYEHELKLNPGLHGRFVLRFVVGTDGRVVDADADEDDLGSEALERCLVDRLAKRWTLPVHPPEETPVVYPFIFAPQAG
jgi:hypothetical protein